MEAPEQSHPYTQLSARVHIAARFGLDMSTVDLEYAVRAIQAGGSNWPEFVRNLRRFRPDPNDEMCMNPVVWRTGFALNPATYHRDGDHTHPCIRSIRHTDYHGQLRVPCSSVVRRAK